MPVELGPSGLGLQVIAKGIEAGDRVALRDPTRPVAPEPEPEAAKAPGPAR